MSESASKKRKLGEAKVLVSPMSSKNGKSYIWASGAAAGLASYPHMREVNGYLHVSGTSSRRPDNTHVGAVKNDKGEWELDIYEQTKAVLTNIEKYLKAAGADLGNVVDTTCFLTDMKHYKGFNKAYNEFFEAATGPTRTTIAVHQLPHPNLLIEIKAIAKAPERS